MADYKKPKIKEKLNKSVSGLTISDILKISLKELNTFSTPSIKKITSRLVSAMNKRIRYLGKSESGKESPTYKRYKEKGFYSIKGLSKPSIEQLFENLKQSLSSDRTTASGWKKYQKEFYDKLNIDFKEKSKQETINEVAEILGKRRRKTLTLPKSMNLIEINKLNEKLYQNLIEENNLTDEELQKFSNSWTSRNTLKEYAKLKELSIKRKFWDVYHKYEEYDKNFQNWKKGRSDEIINFMANEIDFQNQSLDEIKKILDRKYNEIQETRNKSEKQVSDLFEENDIEDEGNF